MEQQLPIKITRIVALSALYDIALLETTNNENPYLSLREDQPLSTEDLFILGYPGGLFQQADKYGRIQPLGNENYGFYINYYDDLRGMSGAPLLDDKQQVTGIHYESVDSFTMSTNGKTLKNLIGGSIGSTCSVYTSPRVCINAEIKRLLTSAEQGSKQAQYKLGIMYKKGIVIEQNDIKAIDFFVKAAEQGYAPSQYELARLYVKYSQIVDGEQKRQMLGEAFYWYNQAAEGAYVPSQVAVALMYKVGLGVEQNNTKAVFWCNRAVDFAGQTALQNDGLVSQCKTILH